LTAPPRSCAYGPVSAAMSWNRGISRRIEVRPRVSTWVPDIR
jgi:hypothetical protein